MRSVAGRAAPWPIAFVIALLMGTAPVGLPVASGAPITPDKEPSSGGPSARAYMGMANDPSSGKVVLFGGLDGTQLLGDTWTWNGSIWTQEHPDTSPSPRCCMGMAYDASRKEVVLFGGGSQGGDMNDTWTWNGATWKEEHPPVSPSARDSMGMAFDTGTGKIVIFGGFGGALDPTWTWDGTTWTKEDPSHSPNWLDGPGMAESRRQVVLFAGEHLCGEELCYERKTWLWNGTDWNLSRQEVRPSRRAFMGMALEAADQQVLLFGGERQYGQVGDTWTWDGTSWTRQAPAIAPPSRWSMGMTYDAARQRVVLFGGEYYDTDYQFRGDTWTWDGTTWERVG